MTPKACSLYDHIKLSELKNGCAIGVSDLPCERNSESMNELIENGFIEIVHRKHTIAELDTVRRLK